MAHERRPRLRGVATIADRPPRIGKIKIGEKVPTSGGRERPTRLDYMKAVTADGDLVQSFHEVYGDRPTSFPAVFPSNDPVDWYWEAYRRYGSGSGLACHGDGRQAIVEDTGETIDCPCSHSEPTLDAQGRERAPACKPVASLSLFLYEVPELGVFQVDTGSINSIRNLRWFIDALPGLTGGQYTGIPIRVYIEPQQVTHDGKASTAYIWHLGLLPGYTPQNLRVAAQTAVDAFLVPPALDTTRLLNEAEPEHLCLGMGDGDQEPEVVEPEESVANHIPAEWAVQVLGAEDRFTIALDAAHMPAAKKDAAHGRMLDEHAAADASGGWAHYAEWLDRQSVALEAKAQPVEAEEVPA